MEPLHLLVVENDAVSAADVKYRLERFGYRVLGIAETGESALEMLETYQPDLVLMDISLAGEMKGIETAAEMRSNFNIPVIFITGYSDENTILRAAAVEPFGYILKPVESRSLYISVRMAMARHELEKKYKAAEDALFYREECFQALARSSRDGILLIEERDIIFGNNKAGKILGFGAQALKGKKITDVFSSETADSLILDEVRGSQGLEIHYRHPDGEEKVFDAVVSSIGNKQSFLCYLKDITGREESSSYPEQGEFEKQVILDAMSEAVLFLDQEGKILWANNAAVLSADMPCEKMKGQPGSDVFGFSFEEKIFSDSGEPLKEQKEIVKEVVSPRGRSCLVKRNPVFDKEGSISGFVVIIEDITEQKLADKALFENQYSLEMILKGGNIGYWNWDIPTGHVTFNRVWAKMLGYHLSDVEPVIDTWRNSLHPDDREELLEKFETLLTAEETSFESVYRLETKSGQWKWFFGNYFVMEKGDALSRRIASVSIDITDRKRAEEEIKRLNAELERRVTVRTEELESANRELKEFAYVVSHDLKAPLRGISQLTGWLKNDFQDVINDEGQMHIDLIMNRARRMNRLIDGILEYSRVGRTENRREMVDCNNLVDEVVELLMPPDMTSVFCENNLPSLLTDRLRLEQVFLNLIGNAVKHMKGGGGTVRISSQKAGNFWQFCVADDGEGIDSRYHEKIFKIFQTLNHQNDEESTGIGLTLVKKIIENSGGKIWLESEAGKGSSFFFTVSEDGAIYEKQKAGIGC